MSRRLKTAMVVVLAVLLAASLALFVFVLTRPSAAYDPAKVKLEVELHTRKRVLSCAYKIYGNNETDKWVANTIIKNVGKIPVYDFKISYKVKNYSDWTSGEEYPVIYPGQTVRDACWPSLNDEKMKSLTSKTPVELIMKYSYRGKAPVEDYEKLEFMGRNDFVLSSLPTSEQVIPFIDEIDNYPLLASFVTPNEETAKRFASQIGGGLTTWTSDEDVLTALVRCFDALRAHGIKYYQPPSYFMNGDATQYVEYPKDTLTRKVGTCVDLSILMSALMEANGVKTYIALIPGHAIPIVELPESKKLVPIESTFMDREFVLSHYQGQTTPEVTAQECIDRANQALSNAYQQGQLVLIDVRKWWDAGVTPSW